MDDNIAPIQEIHDPIAPSNSRKRKREEATIETPFPPRKRRRIEGRWTPIIPPEPLIRKRKREDDQQEDSNKRQLTLEEHLRAVFDLSMNYVKETRDEFAVYLRRLHEVREQVYQDTTELTSYVYRRHLAPVCQPALRVLDGACLFLIVCFLYGVYYSLLFMYWILQITMILVLSFGIIHIIISPRNES